MIEKVGTSAELKRKLLGKVYGIAAMMALSWVPLIAVTAFHHDLLGTDPQPSEGKAQAYFWLGLVVTVAGPVLIWLAIAKIRKLSSTGVRTIATIVKISAASNHDIRPVTYSFQVGPLTYKVKRDTPEVLLRRVMGTKQVPVIYDPANPNSCEILFPKGAIATESVGRMSNLQKWQGVFVGPLAKGLLILAFWGVFILTAVVMRGMGVDVAAYSVTLLTVSMLAVVIVHMAGVLIGDRILGRPDALFVRTRLWWWIALVALLIAVPASIVWVQHDQAADADAKLKHDQEDLENARMMNPNLGNVPSGSKP